MSTNQSLCSFVVVRSGFLLLPLACVLYSIGYCSMPQPALQLLVSLLHCSLAAAAYPSWCTRFAAVGAYALLPVSEREVTHRRQQARGLAAAKRGAFWSDEQC